jgi:hypothetical protein
MPTPCPGNQVVPRWQEVRVGGQDPCLELRVADLGVSVEVETPDYREQLRLPRLVAHLLQEDAQAALCDVTQPDLVNGLEDSPRAEIVRTLQLLLELLQA